MPTGLTDLNRIVKAPGGAWVEAQSADGRWEYHYDEPSWTIIDQRGEVDPVYCLPSLRKARQHTYRLDNPPTNTNSNTTTPASENSASSLFSLR